MDALTINQGAAMDQYIVIDTKTDQPVYRPDGTPVVVDLPPGEYHLEWKEIKV